MHALGPVVYNCDTICFFKKTPVSILQVTVFMSRTFNRRQGLIAGCVVAAVHLLFLLYLHFAYHSVYEGQWQAFSWYKAKQFHNYS